MKILVIEDDNRPDYKDIERCLKCSLPGVEISHLTSFHEINRISPIKKEDYILCITDILEHEGRIDDFDSPYFEKIFYEGIFNISSLYQQLDCYFIVITKIPVDVLKKQFVRLKDDPDVIALFRDRAKKLEDLFDKAQKAIFTICNHSNLHFVTKPYDQYNRPTANYGWWLDQLKKTVSEHCKLWTDIRG